MSDLIFKKNRPHSTTEGSDPQDVESFVSLSQVSLVKQQSAMFESLSFVFHSKLLHSGREEKAMARGTGQTNTRSESEHQMIPYSLIIWYSFQILSESDPFVWKSSQGNPRFSCPSLSSHCDHPPGWFKKDYGFKDLFPAWRVDIGSSPGPVVGVKSPWSA